MQRALACYELLFPQDMQEPTSFCGTTQPCTLGAQIRAF